MTWKVFPPLLSFIFASLSSPKINSSFPLPAVAEAAAECDALSRVRRGGRSAYARRKKCVRTGVWRRRPARRCPSPLSSFLSRLRAEGGEESPGYKLVRVKSSLRSFPERRPRKADALTESAPKQHHENRSKKSKKNIAKKYIDTKKRKCKKAHTAIPEG